MGHKRKKMKETTTTNMFRDEVHLLQHRLKNMPYNHRYGTLVSCAVFAALLFTYALWGLYVFYTYIASPGRLLRISGSLHFAIAIWLFRSCDDGFLLYLGCCFVVIVAAPDFAFYVAKKGWFSLTNPNPIFGKSVIDNRMAWLQGKAINRNTVSPVSLAGKVFYLLLMHPRQKYLMDVTETKMWYRDLMRSIRLLKYFER